MRFEPLAKGFSLTPDDTNATFAIILHNVRTYRSGGVIAVVRGKHKAESTLKAFQEAQGIVPERIDLHGLAPARGYHPTIHLGIHPS